VTVSINSRRKIRRAVVLLLTAVAVIIVLAVVDRLRNKDEEYAVYSAYLSEGILNDAHDWSVDTPIQVIVADKTEMGGIFRLWAFSVAANRLGFHDPHFSTRASFIARGLYQTKILPKFVLPKRATAVVAARADIQGISNSAEFQAKFPHNLGLIILSGVGFNPSRTQAIFYIEHLCGLCGGGRYVLMEKINGAWIVRDEHYTWIS
jgi:hypothetical protein